MKFSLVATLVVVLALTHGSQSEEAPEIEKLKQYFADLTAKTQELASQAQTLLESGKTQLEPLAAQIQEHLKPLASTIEEQIKPLAANVQAQLKPAAESLEAQLEDIFRKLMEQAKAIGQ